MNATRHSKICVAPGASIPDCRVVGIGAVVTKPFNSPYSLIAGVPATVRRHSEPVCKKRLFKLTSRDGCATLKRRITRR